MEQNKFDKAIQSKVEKRRLNPSEGSWGKLSERLDAIEAPKKTNPSLWWGIAASVVGLLFIAFQFYKTDSSGIINPTETPGIVNSSKDSLDRTKNSESQRITIEVDKNKDAWVSTETAKPPKNEVRVKKPFSLTPKAIAEVSLENIESSQRNEQSENSYDDLSSIEVQKIKDIVDHVQVVAQNNAEVSEAYIDSLLAAAEKDIQRQKFLKDYQGRVDAEALLADVESELDESFRAKVFEAVKSSFNSVKTAVANRNN